MNDNLTIFLIMVAAITGAVILMVAMRTLAARRAVGGPERSSSLLEENRSLKNQVSRLEARLSVLETIATDPAQRTAREIEQLR